MMNHVHERPFPDIHFGSCQGNHAGATAHGRKVRSAEGSVARCSGVFLEIAITELTRNQ
jgi:hypothetical protein